MEWVRKAMEAALEQAQAAYDRDEVPVGAVVVKDGKIIAYGHNLREATNDPTAHAEVVALRQASAVLGNWYLNDCWLVTTMEPCPMCMGAAMQARIAGICFGASDAKAGCCGSVCDMSTMPFPHNPRVVGGILEQECIDILQAFFAAKRA